MPQEFASLAARRTSAAAGLQLARREHVDALGRELVRQQAEGWAKVYKTKIPEGHWSKGIPCLSADCIAQAHLFHEAEPRGK